MPKIGKLFQAELIRHVQYYKAHEMHPHDCIYNFVSLGEALREKFPTQDDASIILDLDNLAVQFEDDEIPILTASALAEKVAATFAHPNPVILKNKYGIDELPNKTLISNLLLGCKAMNALLGDNGKKVELNNTSIVDRSIRFFGLDVAQNTLARKQVKNAIKVLQAYATEKVEDGDKIKGKVALTLARDLKKLADDYFSNPVKSAEKVAALNVALEIKFAKAAEDLGVHRSNGCKKMLTICKSFFKAAISKMKSMVMKVAKHETLFLVPTEGTRKINKVKSAFDTIKPTPVRPAKPRRS
jgi:hypothetical protein